MRLVSHVSAKLTTASFLLLLVPSTRSQLPAAVAVLGAPPKAGGPPVSATFAGPSLSPTTAERISVGTDSRGAVLAPAGQPAVSTTPSGISSLQSSSSSAFAFNPIPLEPFAQKYNLSLPEEFLLLEQRLRFVSPQAVPLTDAFKQAILGVYGTFLNSGAAYNLRFNITGITPSTAAPVQYAADAVPPALSPSQHANAEQAAQEAARLRNPTPRPSQAWLQQHAPPPMSANLSQYTSADVVIQTWAHSNSTYLEVTQPSELTGYLAVGMLEHGFQVQLLALGYKVGQAAIPLVEILPLKPLYILETILQVDLEDARLRAFNVEEENMLLIAVNSILGSNQAYSWNYILRGWLDPGHGCMRVVLKTYVTQNCSVEDQILGGSFRADLQRMADLTGIDANFSIGESRQVGTFREEVLTGVQDINPVSSQADTASSRTARLGPSPSISPSISPSMSSSSKGLNTSAMVGMAVGGVLLVSLVAFAGRSIKCNKILHAVLLAIGKCRQRQNALQGTGGSRGVFLWSGGGPWPLKKRSKSSEAPVPISKIDLDDTPRGRSRSIGSPIKPNRPLLFGGSSLSSGTPASDNSGVATCPSTGADSVQDVSALNSVWSIRPDEVRICRKPDGSRYLLGSGSFGQVFKGVKNGVSDVAIKCLLKPDVLHLRLFQREISILRALNYDRSIVQFYGACLQGNNLMLVQEFMEGGDLRDALGADHDNKLAFSNHGAELLMDVARGLHFLHINNCVHRDLKTKNILLTAGWRHAKIADIAAGMAKLMGSHVMSSCEDATGTFAYAAPELLLGNTCDTSADIYSFGVVIWELIKHQVPVRGHLQPVKVPQECPQEVADIIYHCLSSTPSQRPTARGIFEAFRDIRLRGRGRRPSGSWLSQAEAGLPDTRVLS